MNIVSSLKKWLLIFLLISLATATVTYFYFNWQIDQMLGGNTQRVDSSQFSTTSGKIAFTDVAVLSADSSHMVANQVVLINDHKIEAIGKQLAVPDGYHVVQGQGRYLIPGLIDAHVHLKKSHNDLLLYIANGVTHVAEMTGLQEHFGLRDAIKNGAIGPDLFIASPKLNSQSGARAFFRSQFEKRHQSFVTEAEARQAVIDYKQSGFDAIKLSSHLKPELYYVITEQAQQEKIPVVGHLPVGLTLSDLYRSGQSQLAHIDSITHNLMNEFGGLWVENSEAFVAHVEQQADSIAQKLKQKGITLASTVWLHQTRPQQDFDLASFLRSIELEYQNPGWLEGSVVSNGCLPGGNSYENPNNTDTESIKAATIYYQAYNSAIEIMTRALVKHKVAIVAGTDALGACGMIAGFSLHKELQTLNQMGLTPSQVLRAATSVPADWMSTKSGQIKVGYQADLVLLDNNPLEDISHTKKIRGVMSNGHYLDRNTLDQILAAVKQANENSRNVAIDEFIE